MRKTAAVEHRSRLPAVLFLLFSVLCFLHVLQFAWVAEDAYITFRVVDNFVHGDGFRWNVAERVQVYTHPLWMLLHAVFSFVYGNIYRLTIVLSAVCGVAAVAFLCRMKPGSHWHRALLVLAPLTLSRTFDDFAISGLENPLSFLTIAWLLFEWCRPPDRFRLYRFYFVAALCLLTRLDNAVIIAPVLAHVAWRHGRRTALLPALRAVSPLLLWFAFSLVYYGFLFPNTKYAKLNTGIPVSGYVAQGWHYLTSFFFYDAFGFFLVAAAMTMGVYRALAMWEDRTHDVDHVKTIALAIGCVAQVAYVLWVGGDFMNGRFFANAVLVSVAVAYLEFGWMPARRSLVLVLALAAVHAADIFIVRPSVANPGDFTTRHGINNEREYYSPSTGLFSDPAHRFRLYPAGLQSSVVDESGQTIPYVLGTIDRPGACSPLAVTLFATNGVGLLGYCSGRETTIIDNMALTDPLLARLPIADPVHWRIGHFWRAIPPGYWQAVKSGDTSGMSPELARYWTKLRLVTSGDLWNWERLVTIAGFQLGMYPAPPVPTQ